MPIQKSSAPPRSVPQPDEFPDVRVTKNDRAFLKDCASRWAKSLNVDELMYFAAALEYEAKKKRQGGAS